MLAGTHDVGVPEARDLTTRGKVELKRPTVDGARGAVGDLVVGAPAAAPVLVDRERSAEVAGGVGGGGHDGDYGPGHCQRGGDDEAVADGSFHRVSWMIL